MITRRDFILSAGLLGASSVASYWGYNRLARPMSVSINPVGMEWGHEIRDFYQQNQDINNLKNNFKIAKTIHCSVLIVGSGAAGLSAAWYLAKNHRKDFLLLDGIERNGNNAGFQYSLKSLKNPLQNNNLNLIAPSGAHYLAQPSRESIYVRELLSDLGILLNYNNQNNQDIKLIYNEMDLVHAPDERVFDPTPNNPNNPQWHDGLVLPDSDYFKFINYINSIKNQYDENGLKYFAIPIVLSSPKMRFLDDMTFAVWLKQNGYSSPKLLWYLDYCCRDDYGQGIEQVSAFAGLHYFAARASDNKAVLTWADGLNHLSEKMRQYIDFKELNYQELNKLNINSGIENVELSNYQAFNYPATAFKIQEHADFVEVLARDNQNKQYIKIHAKQVICAMPLMMAKRILISHQDYDFNQYFNNQNHQNNLPEYAPWLISNFVLNQFPKEIQGHELAWDNIIHGSRALGYVVATHQQIHVAKPAHTIFTAYRALNHDTPENVRQFLFSSIKNNDFNDLIELAAEDLLRVYGGKRFWKNVLHLDLTIRAHAMSVPKVGYLNQDLLMKLREHNLSQKSRISFAHSDLSGYSVFEEANFWGVQAAKKLL